MIDIITETQNFAANIEIQRTRIEAVRRLLAQQATDWQERGARIEAITETLALLDAADRALDDAGSALWDAATEREAL